VGLLLSLAGGPSLLAIAQAPAAAPAAATSQRGTVKSVAGNTITMATDAGQEVSISVAMGARILQVPVGSTNLAAASTIKLTDIAAGDHILVTGKAGDASGTFNALRVILMKSTDIAELQAAEQADWKANGIGGIVSAVDPATGNITVTSGTRKIVVSTSGKTDFRRFARDSVKYQDAKPGTLADIQAKDQLQARGTKSADGLTVQAVEVISGTFENLSGLIVSTDPATGAITLKDLATKKMVTVTITANADLRTMPAMMAARFGGTANGAVGGGRRGGGGGQDASGGTRSPDLSQMIQRMPTIAAADLHKGDAVMIVASETTPDATTATAITVVSGVDAILTANPNGGMDLGMSLGGGGGGGD
jgi:hypothetical protein